MRRSSREDRVGRARREQTAGLATNAEQQTAQALLTAQERLQFGRQAVDDMYTQVAEKWLAQQAELTHVQKQFLEKALAFYQRLATEESADPAVLFETAKAEQRVGEIQNKLGKHAEAEAAYRRAIELFAQLARDAQDPAKYNQGLAKTRRSLGSLLLDTGRLPDAEQELTLAVGLCMALVEQCPDNIQYQLDLGREPPSYGDLSESDRAEGQGGGGFSRCDCSLRTVADPFPQRPRPEIQLGMCSVERLPRRYDDRDERAATYRSAARMAAEVVAADPKNPEYRLFQAQSLFVGQQSCPDPRARIVFDKASRLWKDLWETSHSCLCIERSWPKHSLGSAMC